MTLKDLGKLLLAILIVSIIGLGMYELYAWKKAAFERMIGHPVSTWDYFVAGPR